jgi:hypothetical protein
MYSVIRFSLNDKERLISIGLGLNACVPGAYDGLDLRCVRFSCSVSSANTVAEHFESIVRFIDKAGVFIKTVDSLGGAVVMDIALEEGDNVGWVTRFEVPWLTALSNNNIALEISDYRPRSEMRRRKRKPSRQ